MPGMPDLTQIVLGVMTIIGLTMASFWVLRPFLLAGVWATMIVVATWPTLRLIQARLWGSRSLAVVAMTLIMILVITFVGFLIHVYSSEFMTDDEGYQRFFAYMNLFVASMLTLVLADNLLLLYLGWEGVGLCSYLLIGFWYRESANGSAAQKAFIVTRIGDTAFSIGLFLLFTHLDTLNIQDLLRRAQQEWGVGAVPAVAAT